MILKSKIIYTCYAIIILIALTIFSCKKNNENLIGHSISFKTDSGYIYKETMVLTGKSSKVGIITDRSDANITNFVIMLNNGTQQTYLDKGINISNLNIDKLFTKGINSEDIWTVIVRDKAGKTANVSLKISTDPNSIYGNIIFIPSIILGTQNNTSTGISHSFDKKYSYRLL